MTFQPVQLQWAKFGPDRSDYDPAYSDATKNVRPIAGAKAPIADFSRDGADLGAEPRGGIVARKANSTTVTYAGTAAKLYRYNASTTAFDEVTRSSGGDYSGSFDWSMAQYGSRIIACNGTDATQYIDVDSGSNFAALSNAPIADHVATVGDFVVFGNLSTNPRARSMVGG